MGLAELQTGLIQFLTDTTAISQTVKGKQGTRFAAKYPVEYAKFLANSGLTNNAANRGAFWAHMTVYDYWKNIFEEGSYQEIRAAQPAPETFG